MNDNNNNIFYIISTKKLKNLPTTVNLILLICPAYCKALFYNFTFLQHHYDQNQLAIKVECYLKQILLIIIVSANTRHTSTSCSMKTTTSSTKVVDENMFCMKLTLTRIYSKGSQILFYLRAILTQPIIYLYTIYLGLQSISTRCH